MPTDRGNRTEIPGGDPDRALSLTAQGGMSQVRRVHNHG